MYHLRINGCLSNNFSYLVKSENMNILVDGRIWSLYSAGIGSFFTGAILEWAEQKGEDTFYIFLPKGLDTKYELPSLPNNIVILDYSRRYFKKLPNIIILQLRKRIDYRRDIHPQ